MGTSDVKPRRIAPGAGSDPKLARTRFLHPPLALVAMGLALAVVVAAGQRQDAREARPKPHVGLEAECAKAMKLIAQRVGKAKPWIKRRPIIAADGSIEMGGEQITAADEKGITVTVIDKRGRRTVQRPWDSLGDAGITSLLKGVANRDSAEECVAAGLVALSGEQMGAAEEHFARAAELGADVTRYRAPLAAAAFARARGLIEQGKFADGSVALDKLRDKYPAWAVAHKKQIANALARAEAGNVDSQAKKLLARGRKVCSSKRIGDLWDLKLVCDELKTKYPDAEEVKKAEPQLVKWAEATSGLGDFIIVKTDGAGNAKDIGQAIKMAKPRSLVQIEDDGPYNEQVVIPKGKEGLLLRGKQGCWPLITSAGTRKGIDVLVSVLADDAALEHLLLVHSAAGALHCLSVEGNGLRLRHVAVSMLGDKGIRTPWSGSRRISLADSIILANARLSYTATIVNTVFVNAETYLGMPAKCERCAFLGAIRSAEGGVLTGCIIGDTTLTGPDKQLRISNSNIRGAIDRRVTRDKDCFREKAPFLNPRDLNFTPRKSSRCGRLAVGCRYTPVMEEMRKRVLELVRKGIIKL